MNLISNHGFVYILINKDEVIYIGATKTPERRVKQHTDKDYSHFVIIETDGYLGLERELIRFHKPKFNITSKVNHKTGEPIKTIFENHFL